MVNDTNTAAASKYSWGDILAGAASGIGIAGNALAPPPGNSTTNIDTKNWTQQDIAQFIQNLVNSSSLTNTTSVNNTSQDTSGVKKFDLDPQTQALLDQLTGSYSSFAKAPLDFRGYQASGIQGINQNSDLQKQALEQIMASRGLSTSPAVSTGLNNIESNRFGQINQFNQQLPLLQNDLIGKNLGQASDFFGRIPLNTSNAQLTTGQQTGGSSSSTASQSSSTSDTHGTNITNSTGNELRKTTVPEKSTSSKILGTAGGIAATLAGLFSDETLKEDIHPVDRATEVIMALKPVTWKWKGDSPNGTGKSDAGVIAQDIAKVLPALVSTDKVTNLKKVNYAGMIPYLVGAFQELKGELSAAGGKV